MVGGDPETKRPRAESAASRYAERVRAAFEGWNISRGRDASGFLALVGERLDFWSVGSGQPVNGLGFTGLRTTREEFADYFTQLTRGWRLDFIRIRALVAEGAQVMVMTDIQYTARLTGKPCHTLGFTYFRFEGPYAVEIRDMFDSASALAALMPS